MKMVVGLEKFGSSKTEGEHCGSEGRWKRMNVREETLGLMEGKEQERGFFSELRNYPQLRYKVVNFSRFNCPAFLCPPPLNPQFRLFPLPQPQGTQRKRDSPVL